MHCRATAGSCRCHRHSFEGGPCVAGPVTNQSNAAVVVKSSAPQERSEDGALRLNPKDDATVLWNGACRPVLEGERANTAVGQDSPLLGSTATGGFESPQVLAMEWWAYFDGRQNSLRDENWIERTLQGRQLCFLERVAGLSNARNYRPLRQVIDHPVRRNGEVDPVSWTGSKRS